MRKNRGRVAFVIALGFLSASALAGVAVASKMVSIPIETVQITLDGGVRPKVLSRSEPTPITFNISGDIGTLNDFPPPPLRKFILEVDKNAAIDVEGMPVCTASQPLPVSTTVVEAEAACRSAIIGRGHVTVTFVFAGERQIPFEGRTVVFNGGSNGRVTTLYIHGYLTEPVPVAIVSTVKIKKIHNGRYGLLAMARIPVIAGEGSITHFDLTIKKRGVLSAKCPDGKLRAHAEAVFADETILATTLSRSCIPKG